MSPKSILVTGGAGYIGSHVLLQLRERGERVVALDNLTTGFRQSVLGAPLVVADIGDRGTMQQVLREYDVDTVMHFAANTVVPESVRDPLKYYANNTCATRNLLAACMECGVRQMVFSSTAAVYGVPAVTTCSEDTPPAPINPYGTSKLMSEWILRDLAAAVSDFRYVSLRYFNVAGSDPQCRIGQATRNATLLIKVAVEAIVGKRSHVSIFGTDFDTPDGTGVRDYVHVDDLARAHVDALEYLRRGGSNTICNVGYGSGYSVREVLHNVQRVAAKQLSIRHQPRREGDPPILIAQAERVRSVLGWQPRFDRLDTIVEHALRWEEKLKQEPW
jgi:UDP-glucose 4-epimerase